MDILLFLIIFSALVGYWANNWGRNGWVWFFLALIISPLITSIALLIMGKDSALAIEDEAQKSAAVEKRKKELLKK